MPATATEWQETANTFEKKWNFNNCIGAIDGKHVSIHKPPSSGFSYYNSKGFFSTVLLAVVNANYEFMYVNTGTNGSASDESVLQNTKFYEKLMRGKLNLPQPSTLPSTCTSVPYVFVGDSAFAINKHIMTPYPFKNISHEEKIFTCRLSRARRVAENAFGILALRFQIFKQCISVDVSNVDPIVLACCVLHNYMIKKSPGYISEGFVDNEDTENFTFRQGEWRQNGDTASPEEISLGQQNEEGNDVRNAFTIFFSGEGAVSFQEKMQIMLCTIGK